MEIIEDEPASIPVARADDAEAAAPAAAPAVEAPEGGAEAIEMVQEAPAGMRETPLFSDFTVAELSDVLARLRHKSFAARERIVGEGDPGDSLFVLCQGRVKVVGTGPGGKPIELAELGEGDFFGEVALLTGKPRTATITCVEETEVLELTREDLEELEGRHPRIRQVIQDFYEKRVEDTVESMLDAVRLPDPE
jgi:cAMP-dependent protein kinase regulator